MLWRIAADGVGLNMMSDIWSKLKKRRACGGVKGNRVEESGGGGCRDCMLRRSGGGVWGFLRLDEGPLPCIEEVAEHVWESLPFFQIYRLLDWRFTFWRYRVLCKHRA